MKSNIITDQNSYISLNATVKLFDAQGNFQFENDLLAVQNYLKNEIYPKCLPFSTYEDKLNFLLAHNYYDAQLINLYQFAFLVKLHKHAQSYQFHFPSFVGAFKFYTSYALKSFDHKYYLEHYEDRVMMNALLFAQGNEEAAWYYVDEMMSGRYQPATPTFLNAGKKQRGEFVSCYLLRIEDNMESISRAVTVGLQLSKRGGGVSYCLTNLREFGAPIKQIQHQATGIIPVMKILEDVFSYANQLGQRQGAGAVYLNVFHPEIMRFLDSKRENADEKIRIKSLSLGVIIPDIAFELAKANAPMALFSPYDVFEFYQKPMSDIAISQEYYNMLNNPKIKKTYISARKLFLQIAEVQFESGYPFILFDDRANANNPHYKQRVIMSNLCSEIIQTNTPSELASDLTYQKIGEDVCCNLGSLNIAKVMEQGEVFHQTVARAVSALNTIAHVADLTSAPTIHHGNKKNRAIGLGVMNLHGFLATNQIYYDSVEAVDFVNCFFYALAFYAFKASNELAQKNQAPFANFMHTKYANGSYFDKYTKCAFDFFQPKTAKIKSLLKHYNFVLPTQQD